MKRIATLILALAIIASVAFIGQPIVGASPRQLDVSINLAQTVVQHNTTPPVHPSVETTITPTTWGYEYLLENGDIVQVGDNTTTDFKANVKTIRKTGLAWFSLGWLGGTFSPSVDNLTVSFDFNNSTNVAVYPVPPSNRLPEGGIEYDITLDRKPAKPEVTLDIDWENISWQKILPLNEQYTIDDCIAKWGDTHTDFVIVSTDVWGTNIETLETDTLKHLELYEVNSYLGTVLSPTVTTTDHGVITADTPNKGKHLLHSSVSRSYLYIHRGQMADALGETAWVEDINLDEQAHTLTFTLPKTWLQNATYPVSQLCGVDPAYSELMDSFLSTDLSGDSTWTTIDLTAYGVADSSVAEIICGMQENGVENYMGVKAVGSGNTARKINLHEAEGGGETHIRMFVQTDSSAQAQFYHSDISDDDSFYVVGYWENTTFTDNDNFAQTATYASWVDVTLPDSGAASRVCQIVFAHPIETAPRTGGVRANGSSLERKVMLNEAENGGQSAIDFIVKADADYTIEHYREDVNAQIYFWGYFGSEMDFVELWETPSRSGVLSTVDCTAYLDEDGRVTDWMLLHWKTGAVNVQGVWGYDLGSSFNKYLTEHEAEDNGTNTDEKTGFSMSAQTDASGRVYTYDSGISGGESVFYLTGYFLPAGGAPTPDISNTPSTWVMGIVSANTTYYAKGSTPGFPLASANTTFAVTNNTSGGSVNITIVSTDFRSSDNSSGWTLASSPAQDTVTFRAFSENATSSSNSTILTNNAQGWVYSLGEGDTHYWELSLEAPTSFTFGKALSANVTLTAEVS